MVKKWFGKKEEQTDEILNDGIDTLVDGTNQSEEASEVNVNEQSEVEEEVLEEQLEEQLMSEAEQLENSETDEETSESKKFVIGVVGKITDRQKETIKLSAKHIAGFSKKLNYDEIEVVELSENDEENEGICVDVRIDKNKEISKFAESGLGMSLASKCMTSDFQALLGSGKNRRATKKKRRK